MKNDRILIIRNVPDGYHILRPIGIGCPECKQDPGFLERNGTDVEEARIPSRDRLNEMATRYWNTNAETPEHCRTTKVYLDACQELLQEMGIQPGEKKEEPEDFECEGFRRSDCCNALICDETDICSLCQEHSDCQCEDCDLEICDHHPKNRPSGQ